MSKALPLNLFLMRCTIPTAGKSNRAIRKVSKAIEEMSITFIFSERYEN